MHAPTYQQLEQSAEQFDNQSDSRASRPHIAPALKVSDLSPAHLHVIPGEARAGGGGEAGEAGCRLFNNLPVSVQSEPVNPNGGREGIKATPAVQSEARESTKSDLSQGPALGSRGGQNFNTSELNCESGRSPRGGNNPLTISLADQAQCSMTIREQISLMRRGDKFHFIALATNLIQVLENERNAVIDRIAEMED